jgi:NAD(P)H-hydrate epimerase
MKSFTTLSKLSSQFFLGCTPLCKPSEIKDWEEDYFQAHSRSSSLQEGAVNLMHQVGKLMAERILLERSPPFRAAVVLVGPGRNGGDGFVVARHLCQAGVSVTVIEAKRLEEDSGDVDRLSIDPVREQIAREFENQKGCSWIVVQDELSEEVAKRVFTSAEVCIDALLGVGQNLNNSLRGSIANLCRASNEYCDSKSCFRVSLDVPTGVDANSGAVHVDAFRPSLTLTVGMFKRGFFQAPAINVMGKLEIIPVPIFTRSAIANATTLLVNNNIRSIYPFPPANSHKGMLGSVLVIGAVSQYLGASILACHAAISSGAGRVIILVDNETRIRLAGLWPEVIVQESSNCPLSVPEDLLNPKTSLVVGPGLGVGRMTVDDIVELVKKAQKNDSAIVIDADALTILSQGNGLSPMLPLNGRVVATPHPGEAARLLKVSVEEINRDRYAAARSLAELLGCVVILKGQGTIIDDGLVAMVCTAGTSALSTSGTGDVLAGIVAALMARGLSSLEASVLGVNLHGSAGLLASGGRACIRASEVIETLPRLVFGG